MTNAKIEYLRNELSALWKIHKEIMDEIESLEYQLAIELEKAENGIHNNRKRWW